MDIKMWCYEYMNDFQESIILSMKFKENVLCKSLGVGSDANDNAFWIKKRQQRFVFGNFDQ